MSPQLVALKGRFASTQVLNQAPSGVPDLDLPRGAITEVIGAPSSGRTTLLCAALAAATRRQEACALLDTGDAFDPASGVAAGIDPRFLLWVRCANNKRAALQVADWLLYGGGFGVVALDMGDLTPQDVRNIPMPTWFRFRHAVENRPTSLLVIAPEHCVGSTATLQLEMRRQQTQCRGLLLQGARLQAIPRKPVQSAGVTFEAGACLLA